VQSRKGLHRAAAPARMADAQGAFVTRAFERILKESDARRFQKLHHTPRERTSVRQPSWTPMQCWPQSGRPSLRAGLFLGAGLCLRGFWVNCGTRTEVRRQLFCHAPAPNLQVCRHLAAEVSVRRGLALALPPSSPASSHPAPGPSGWAAHQGCWPGLHWAPFRCSWCSKLPGCLLFHGPASAETADNKGVLRVPAVLLVPSSWWPFVDPADRSKEVPVSVVSAPAE